MGLDIVECVQIQTIDYCNRKCDWCPNKYLGKKPDLLMKKEIFLKILSDLKELNYKGEIQPYLMAEALCDNRLKEWVAIIRNMFPDNIIMINTNGDFLKNKEDVEELVKAGINKVIINLYDSSNDHLIEETIDMKEVKINQLGDIEKNFNNRASLVDNEPRHKGWICDYILRRIYINYRGDVILCCADYYYKVIHGNVTKSKLVDIWNSEKYRYFRKECAERRGSGLPLCNKCNIFMR